MGVETKKSKRDVSLYFLLKILILLNKFKRETERKKEREKEDTIICNDMRERSKLDLTESHFLWFCVLNGPVQRLSRSNCREAGLLGYKILLAKKVMALGALRSQDKLSHFHTHGSPNQKLQFVLAVDFEPGVVKTWLLSSQTIFIQTEVSHCGTSCFHFNNLIDHR